MDVLRSRIDIILPPCFGVSPVPFFSLFAGWRFFLPLFLCWSPNPRLISTGLSSCRTMSVNHRPFFVKKRLRHPFLRLPPHFPKYAVYKQRRTPSPFLIFFPRKSRMVPPDCRSEKTFPYKARQNDPLFPNHSTSPCLFSLVSCLLALGFRPNFFSVYISTPRGLFFFCGPLTLRQHDWFFSSVV